MPSQPSQHLARPPQALPPEHGWTGEGSPAGGTTPSPTTTAARGQPAATPPRHLCRGGRRRSDAAPGEQRRRRRAGAESVGCAGVRERCAAQPVTFHFDNLITHLQLATEKGEKCIRRLKEVPFFPNFRASQLPEGMARERGGEKKKGSSLAPKELLSPRRESYF